LQWRGGSLAELRSVLRIVVPDELHGSILTKTLPVRPNTTTRDVCKIIAHKIRITNPQDYGLYKLVDGEGKSNIGTYTFSGITLSLKVKINLC
jgi:Ras association (RalGDS/AF-6) domain